MGKGEGGHGAGAPAEPRQRRGAAHGDRSRARRRRGRGRDLGRRRAASTGGDPAAPGTDRPGGGGRSAGRAGPHGRDAARATLHQLALGGPRLAHRQPRGAGCADRLPGAGAPGRRARAPARDALRFRGRVPARGPGARLAGALGADRHRVHRPPQPLPALGGHLAPGARVHALRPPDHLRSAMNILISNDDGILARGLAVLGEVCASLGQVTVVAPDREQSGTSHSLTLHRPLHATRRPDATFQVDGTPTDCVLLAIGMLMPEKPDFVISGINHGQNMGEDVFYSGTVAAAMEGLVAGIPSIAVSYAGSDFRATSDGYISVTPLHMDMTNYDLLEDVRQWFPGD